MGKFILSVDQGRYAFHFNTANGDRIAVSAPHITRSAALHALTETKKCSPEAQFYQQKQGDGQYYFELRNAGGNVLVTSTKFGSAQHRNQAITIMQREAELAGFTEAIMI